jgi:hypothetical protein
VTLAVLPRHRLDISDTRIARQHFGFLHHGQPLTDSESIAGESFSERYEETHQWIRQARLASL